MERAALEELFAIPNGPGANTKPRLGLSAMRPFSGQCPGPALRDALAHLNWAYDRWLTDPTRTSDIPVEAVASRGDVEGFRQRVRGRFRKHLDSLDEAALTTPLEMNIDGEVMPYAPADILTLLLLHEREHHGDLNTLLYQMGVDPVQTSYRFFLMETRRRG